MHLSIYIKSKQKQKADDITQRVRRIQPFFDETKLIKIFQSLQQIKVENAGTNLLRKSTMRLLDSLQLDSSVTSQSFSSVVTKLSAKAANPYEEVLLTPEEEKVCKAVSMIIGKMSKLLKAFEKEKQSLQLKIEKTSEYTKCKSLYEASLGEAHESIEELISIAKEIVEIGEAIHACQLKIDDLFEMKKLDTINDFLRELNVNFRVILKDRKYCVQIIGYEATEYSKENKILCSEGTV